MARPTTRREVMSIEVANRRRRCLSRPDRYWSGDRVLVHESLAEEFTRKFTAKAASLRDGDPAHPHPVIGPLVSAEAAQRVARLVCDAVAKGTTVLVGRGRTGGRRAPGHGAHRRTDGCRAVLRRGVRAGVRVVAVANDTDHGLTCGIITENATHGLAVARRIRTGIVHVSDQSVADEPQAPFGGVKTSGYGRFGGRWGVEAFSNPRWVTIATQHADYPF